MNEVVHTSPTIGSNVEEVVWKNIHFIMWDLGGQESLRAAWNTYYTNTEVKKDSKLHFICNNCFFKRAKQLVGWSCCNFQILSNPVRQSLLTRRVVPSTQRKAHLERDGAKSEPSIDFYYKNNDGKWLDGFASTLCAWGSRRFSVDS